MKRLVLALILALISLSTNAKSIELVKDNKTEYRIIIPNNSNLNTRYAAELFQSNIEKISGVRIPIRTDNQRPRKKEVLIGKTNRIKNYNETQGLVRYYTNKQRLVIYGTENWLEKDNEFDIYAVVEFLERELGVRKYSPDSEYYPKIKAIVLDKNKLDYSFKPINIYRQVRSKFTRENKDFKFWLKQHIQEDLFAKGYFVHTFERLVPRAKYFESNPEYYSLIGDKRMHDQLCLTNPEVRDIVIAKLREEMKTQPDALVWSVSQSDNFSYCSCENCKAINDREESPSGALIEFVNSIAREFPDKIISTLAYQYSRKAPKHLRPEDNVQIMLCTIEEDRNISIEEKGEITNQTNPEARSFAKDIRDWGRISNNIFLWDYEVNFDYSVSPFPNLHTIKPNLEFFIKNNAYQHFQQANSEVGHEFAELKTYLISKLLWDIEVDMDEVVNDFLKGYYGEASAYIRKYIDTLEYYGRKSGDFLDIYGPPTNHANSFLSQEYVDIYTSLLDRAEEAVKNDPILLLRTRTARLPLWFAIMEIGKADMFGKRGWYYEDEAGRFILRQEMKDNLENFYSTSMDAKVGNINESNISPKEYYESTKRFVDIKVENNLAFRKKVLANPMPSESYSNGDMSTLTNGVNGDSEYKIHWLGWNGLDFVLYLDLGETHNNKTIKLSSLYFPKSWILHPKKVIAYTSLDGENYQKIGEVEVGDIQNDEEVIREYIFDSDKLRYIRLEIESTQVLPYWHASQGGRSWVFLDELIVE